MSEIVEFTAGNLAFEPQAVEAMSSALDQVCAALNVKGQGSAREIIALRILELARRGERDPTILRDRLLNEANSGSRC